MTAGKPRNARTDSTQPEWVCFGMRKTVRLLPA